MYSCKKHNCWSYIGLRSTDSSYYESFWLFSNILDQYYIHLNDLLHISIVEEIKDLYAYIHVASIVQFCIDFKSRETQSSISPPNSVFEIKSKFLILYTKLIFFLLKKFIPDLMKCESLICLDLTVLWALNFLRE